jgi:hypothetical protein
MIRTTIVLSRIQLFKSSGYGSGSGHKYAPRRFFFSERCSTKFVHETMVNDTHFSNIYTIYLYQESLFRFTYEDQDPDPVSDFRTRSDPDPQLWLHSVVQYSVTR